jgi:hypothetical protein
MQDYDGGGVPDGREEQVSNNFSTISIFKKKREMKTIKSIVHLMMNAAHIPRPICLVY